MMKHMKKKTIAMVLAALAAMTSLTACSGGQTAAPAGGEVSQAEAAPMTEEEYEQEVTNLSQEVSDVMTSMSSLSMDDEDAFRQGVDTVRTMADSFRSFASIPNPPEHWAEAHGKIAEGCTLFADSLDGMCDSAEKLMSGEMEAADYSTAVLDYTDKLNEAASLLTEGMGMLDV